MLGGLFLKTGDNSFLCVTLEGRTEVSENQDFTREKEGASQSELFEVGISHPVGSDSLAPGAVLVEIGTTW